MHRLEGMRELEGASDSSFTVPAIYPDGEQQIFAAIKKVEKRLIADATEEVRGVLSSVDGLGSALRAMTQSIAGL